MSALTDTTEPLASVPPAPIERTLQLGSTERGEETDKALLSHALAYADSLNIPDDMLKSADPEYMKQVFTILKKVIDANDADVNDNINALTDVVSSLVYKADFKIFEGMVN